MSLGKLLSYWLCHSAMLDVAGLTWTLCCCCLHQEHILVSLLSPGTFWANIYNKWGGWKVNPRRARGDNGALQGLVKAVWATKDNGSFRILCNQKPPTMCTLDKLQHPAVTAQTPFIDFSLFCVMLGLIFCTNHCSYVVSIHLPPQFTFKPFIQLV